MGLNRLFLLNPSLSACFSLILTFPMILLTLLVRPAWVPVADSKKIAYGRTQCSQPMVSQGGFNALKAT